MQRLQSRKVVGGSAIFTSCLQARSQGGFSQPANGTEVHGHRANTIFIFTGSLMLNNDLNVYRLTALDEVGVATSLLVQMINKGHSFK